MAFSTENSGRRIVTSSPNWKSRSLNLGNRHRTTLNFGDLVPAYWCHVQPGDKLRMDANILAKFLPLIAPAFSRMKIKTEWFYVPLRQISPSSLRALQDFTPRPEDVSSYFSQLLHGFSKHNTGLSEDQQINQLNGFPSVPAWALNMWLCGDTATYLNGPNGSVLLGSAFSPSSWRNGSNISAADYSNLGYEGLVTYSSKRRASRLMSYMGLPPRVTQMRYTMDAVFHDYSSSNVDYTAGYAVVKSADGTPIGVYDDDLVNLNPNSDCTKIVDLNYFALSFVDRASIPYNSFSVFNASPNNSYLSANSIHELGLANAFKNLINSSPSSLEFPPSDFYGLFTYSGSEFYVPFLTTYNESLISLLPFQAYQKIFNDFYRDEKLQDEEIRYYPDAVLSVDGLGLQRQFDTSLNDSICRWSSVGYVMQNVQAGDSDCAALNVAFNNLFGLRRRNRAKDVISSCVTSQVVVGQLQGGTNETVYNANLYSKLAKFFMKKEFTGSTWAEWLNNFFGVNSNDLLNNNVVFLGGRESVVSISENIQNSESSQDSPQGNRAGLAGDFHSGKEIYFRAPDFGVIMCIVSVIPDDIDNFNGLQERFKRCSVFDWNLPDLQNIGFAPVLNERVNIGYVGNTYAVPASGMFDIPQSNNKGVFGFQPFGYSHTYTPNIISGDMQKSLRFWHQSPDLDFDFSMSHDFGSGISSLDFDSWSKNQPALNLNLPSIGLRFSPLGSDLKAQYYNNVFAVTNDESGDHIVSDMRFSVTCHRNTAFFTDAVEDEQ